MTDRYNNAFHRYQNDRTVLVYSTDEPLRFTLLLEHETKHLAPGWVVGRIRGVPNVAD